MRFSILVWKTDFWDGDKIIVPTEPPLAGAFKIENWIVQTREIWSSSNSVWESEGKNHRYDKENKQYVRDFLEVKWFVDLNTLEELLLLCENEDLKIFAHDPAKRDEAFATLEINGR